MTQCLNQTLSPRLEVELGRRWKEIEPALLAELKSFPITAEDVSLAMNGYKLVHRKAILRYMLPLGIGFRAIRRLNLDDPRLTDAQRADQISAFLARRAKKPGRNNLKMGQTIHNRNRQAILPGDI